MSKRKPTKKPKPAKPAPKPRKTLAEDDYEPEGGQTGGGGGSGSIP